MATSYEQPANVLSRVRYYDGEFLKDEDLIAEQQFHIDGKWRHDRLLHAPGIAEGLDVSLTQDTSGTVRLQVSAGTAVDSRGRTIILGAARPVDIRPEWSGERWVVIRFNEQEDRIVQEDSATGGVGGATRLTQNPIIDVVQDLAPLTDPQAPVALDLVRFAAGVQPTLLHKRTFAGLRLPGPGAGSTLQVRAEPAFAAAYLDTPLEVTGDVKLSGARLKNAGGLPIIQTNANDWLRINPDSKYPGTALYNPVAIGSSGLAVGEWTKQPKGRLVVTENAYINGNVGIGTQTPNKKLTVDSPGTSSNHANVELRQTGSNAWGVGLVLRTTGGHDGAAMLFRSRDKNWQLRGETGETATGFQLCEDGGDAEYGSAIGEPRIHISAGGNVGIGTTTPSAKLEIAGDAKVSGSIYEASTLLSERYAPLDHSHAILKRDNSWVALTSDGDLQLIQDEDIWVTSFSKDGHIHSNLTTDDYRFQFSLTLDGNLEIRNENGDITWSLNTGASDATLKRDVEPIHGAMEKLRQVRGVSFFWRDAERGTQREMGVLAQEVQPVLPELVSTLGGQHLNVRYDRFVPVLIQALKEQDDRIALLEARLRDLGITP